MKKTIKRVVKVLLWGTVVFGGAVMLLKMYDQSVTIKQQRATIHRLNSTETTEEIQQVENNSTEQELEEARIRITELEQQINKGITDNTYLSIKFPTDGYYYKERNAIKFYSDPTCTVEISASIRFMSKKVDSDEAENGLAIYCLRMDSGEVCYCPQNKGYPELITEQEYNQIKAAAN